MQDNCGCYSQEKLNFCSFMQQGEITLKSIFESEIPTKDKYWFFCKKVATEGQNKKIAIDLAEMVMPIWENRYPDDKRPYEAIRGAKQYLAGHISMNELLTKRKAAYAAAFDADAAAGAAHDNAAAYAAVAADNAVAYAADADNAAAYAGNNTAAYADAYAAACAAYDAADDASYDIKKRIEDYLMTLL